MGYVMLTYYRQNESFKGLLGEIADEAGILSSDLTLTYNGAHVYSTSTPQSLGIWSEANLGMSIQSKRCLALNINI